MKYMIFAHMSQQTWDHLTVAETQAPDELRAVGEFLETFVADLTASGELIDSGGFAAPAEARRVQLRDGESVVTDRPFADTDEVLAGYWVVECAGLERATEIAARINESPHVVPEAGVLIRRLL